MINEQWSSHRPPPPDLPHVVFVSLSDPLDIRSFSAVLVHMVGALREQFPGMEVVRHARPHWFARLQRLTSKLTSRTDPSYWASLNRWFTASLLRRWSGRRIVMISVVNSTLGGSLAAAVPVINVSDATFALMRNFYPMFERLGKVAVCAAEDAERRAIRQSVHNCYSSKWAAQSAIDHYGASAADVSIIPWGCNLPYVDPAQARFTTGVEPWRLLFVGGDWQRKGGDIVLETYRLLQDRGLPVTLDIVGAGPAAGPVDLPGVTSHGFLSKGDKAQSARMDALYRDAEFLFLPTRQDCTPMVFAEANAYGTPALTRDVGGVSGVVENGVNGYLLAHDATPEDFAERIERSWRDRAGHDQLRKTSRSTYEDRLNWPAWARAMRQIVETLTADGLI